MTEPEAYIAYQRHVRDHGCASRALDGGWRAASVCADGARLREQWRTAAEAQDRGIQPIRAERTRSGRR